MYKCPQCGTTSEQMMNCPTHNVPMVEVAGQPASEEKAQGGDQPTTESQSSSS